MDSKKFDLYFEKLLIAGVTKEQADKLREKYGDLLFIATYNTKIDSGLAYEGALIDTVLSKLANFAFKVNSVIPERARVSSESLIKVCLLQHISKAVRMRKQTDEFRLRKLGEAFTYVNGFPAIGIGLHSMMMAMECGIEFTPLEAEAMTIIDRSSDDLQAKYHSSMLSTIVRQANELVYAYVNEVLKVNKETEGKANDEQGSGE